MTPADKIEKIEKIKRKLVKRKVGLEMEQLMAGKARLAANIEHAHVMAEHDGDVLEDIIFCQLDDAKKIREMERQRNDTFNKAIKEGKCVDADWKKEIEGSISGLEETRAYLQESPCSPEAVKQFDLLIKTRMEELTEERLGHEAQVEVLLSKAEEEEARANATILKTLSAQQGEVKKKRAKEDEGRIVFVRRLELKRSTDDMRRIDQIMDLVIGIETLQDTLANLENGKRASFDDSSDEEPALKRSKC